METMMHASLHSPPDSIEQPDCKRQKVAPMIWLNNVCRERTEVDDCAMLDKAVFEKLLKEKKLSLVLDLDHTLLHSVRFNTLTQEERDVIIKQGDTNSSFKGSLYRVKFMEEKFVTKLRPGLEYFLEEARKMFRLHIFTKGCRDYAMGMVKLIDPGNIYFGCTSRIFTRESCVWNDQKSLDLVIGKESGILILDDQERVWREKDKENVVMISRYNFFTGAGAGTGKSLLAAGIDECKTKGPLVIYLRFLKLIHAMFFNPVVEGNLSDRDVRVLKKKLLEYLRKVSARTAGDATVNGATLSSIL